MQIHWVGFATPNTITPDAYREFCWGADLPETPTGYRLLFGCDADWQPITAVLSDVEHVRLLKLLAGVEVPADKVVVTIPDWPNLRSTASSVWS
ncbi:hypothetical protein [Streptomyces litchfieldiae]|uniref:Uncharacterized protein n=1 Tax=Streptomyces litchfieldiae TaxID=3075543 RepID=A0ABU2N1E7_9ACTN|nr:hypothetical protein [Streptomyces sp. DSM 44938]MDT0347733.1 hypothetical protein [Streptomyces sp. DSM 44938]